MVRGAGAAGAAVALKVEDHSAPLFAEPVVEQPLTRRRRSKVADESPETAASGGIPKRRMMRGTPTPTASPFRVALLESDEAP